MVKLAELAPNAEEIAQARAALAALDAKGRKSKMSSMAFFLKNNPENEIAKGTRGDKRKEYLELWMVHSFREKQAKLSLTNSRSVSEDTQKHQDVFWWSKHKMQQEMGTEKAQAWIDSGRLDERPDAMTNKSGEWLTEFAVPIDWATKVTSVKAEAKLEAETAGDAEKAKLMEEASIEMESAIKLGLAKTLGAQASKPEAVVKLEPKEEQTEDEKMAESIKQDPKSWLRLHQEMRTQLMEIVSRSEGKKFMTNLSDECNKLLPKVKGLTTIFDGMLSKKPDEKGFPNLCKRIRPVADEYEEIIDHAVRLGVIEKKKQKAKRKLC